MGLSHGYRKKGFAIIGDTEKRFTRVWEVAGLTGICGVLWMGEVGGRGAKIGEREGKKRRIQQISEDGC